MILWAWQVPLLFLLAVCFLSACGISDEAYFNRMRATHELARFYASLYLALPPTRPSSIRHSQPGYQAIPKPNANSDAACKGRLRLLGLFASLLGLWTARKVDGPAADQAATTNVAEVLSLSCCVGLIQTISGCRQQRVAQLQRRGSC